MRRTGRQRFDKAGALALAPQAWGGYFDVAVVGEEPDAFERVGSCAILDVCGPLLSRAEGFWGSFFDSYPAIRERAVAAFDSKPKAVVLRIDSPGGDVAGCFELARELRAMAEASGIPLVAFTDAMAASAGYALASAAQEIVVTPTAVVGSVGVINAMCDVVEMNRAMGLNVAVITSGARKADGHPDVAITEEAVATMKEHVDDLASVFFALVEDMRGLPAASVRALEGGIFYGTRATSAGLADRVSTWTDMLAGLEAGDQPENRTMKPKGSKYDEAIGALQRAAEGDDDDAKKAKKALKAIEDGDGPGDDDEKRKDDEAKSKKAEDEKKDAEARAVALAREVQELKAKDARRDAAEAAAKEQAARAALFAKRPDITGKVKAALEQLPVAALEQALTDFPRVVADGGAAAAALTPSGGAPPTGESGRDPRLSAEEQAILDGLKPQASGPKKAVQVATGFRMPAMMTQEDARKRLAELEAEQKGG